MHSGFLASVPGTIFHPTYLHTFVPLPWVGRTTKVVMTVYDFVWRRFKTAWSEDAAKAQSEMIERADALICISESTLRDLREFHPGAEKKAIVIPLAAGAVFCAEGDVYERTAGPFLLYVGNRHSYKNFISAFRAFQRLAADIGELQLIVVGPPVTESESAEVVHCGLEGRILFLGFVSDDELAKLYRGCLAFLYVSLYEGFGIPIIEAMRCGAPVIACRTSSVPEVAGDAAILLERGNPDEIAEAVCSVMQNPERREKLRQRGLARAAQFSWRETAEQTFNLYRSL